MKNTVLLSTALGPMRETFFNSSPADVMNQRFSRGCDIFTMHGHLHVNFGHVIAQNIKAPSVLLEYPTREQYVRELEKGYGWLGIGSFNNEGETVLEMLRLARKHAPNTRTVVGGYGAMGLKHLVPPAVQAELIDHNCQGEGARFFRSLLGDDENAPMQVTHLPRWGYSLPWLHKHPRGNVAPVVASVGCGNACDFCASTPMFGAKAVRLLSPEQVHREFRRAWTENPYTPQAVLLEDDAPADMEFIRDLGKRLREDKEFGGLSRFNFFCLGSLRALSRWDLDELALCGVSVVFVGVESKLASDNGYGKADADAAAVFKGLHRRGIATVGAWMAGFDFQTPENIQEDLDAFIELEPTFQQLTRACAFPGTKLWFDMRREGRIPDEVPWNEISFYFGGGLRHQRLPDSAIHRLLENGYRRLYETWGSCAARMYKVHQQGYEYFHERRGDPFYRDRSLLHRAMCQQLFPALYAMEIYAPTPAVRKRMKDLQRRHAQLFGPPTTFQKALAFGIRWLAALEKMKDVVHPRENLIKDEPSKVYDYTIERRLGEKPYRVAYPHRPASFRLARAMQGALWGSLRAVHPAFRLIDRIRGLEPSPDPARENPLVYGS